MVNIDDHPLLVKTVMLLVDDDVLCFLILTAIDVKGESSVVDNVLTNVSEHLPPLLSIGGDLEVLFATIALNVKDVIWVLS